jgi:hypothetical protein
LKPFTGIPALRSTALPRHGQTMLRSIKFPRVLYPARNCTPAVVGEAIRTRRIE